MSISCPSIDTNFLSPNGFIFSIDRLPNTTFFVQAVEIPSVTLPSMQQATPLSAIEIPSDKMQFSPLQLTFIVDENMQNWLEVFKWIQGLGFPESYSQYTAVNQRNNTPLDLPSNYSDATLVVLNSHNNRIRTINFIDCFPSNLGGVRFNTTNTDVIYVTCDLTLEYSYYTIE